MKLQSLFALLALALSAVAAPGGGGGGKGGQSGGSSGGSQTCLEAYNACQSQGKQLCCDDGNGNCDCISSGWANQNGNQQLSEVCKGGAYTIEYDVIVLVVEQVCSIGPGSSPYGGGPKVPISSCQEYS